MGFLDLLSWIADRTRSTGDDEDELPEEVAELADEATGESVTPEVLGNRTGRSYRSIVEYIEDDEQPEFVVRGGPVIISDAEDTAENKFPTRETQVVVTDRRVLFVLGGRISDELWGVQLDDVVEVYVDDVEPVRRYLIVEADSDETEMTFIVDVSIEGTLDPVRAAVEYVREHGADGEGPTES